MLKRQIQMWFCTLTVAFVVGCSTFGVPTPANFGERILAAQVSNTAVVAEAGKLQKLGKLSKSDAQNILKQTDAAEEAITLAAGMVGVDTAAGDARLLAAQQTILALQTYLATKRKGN
jgi:hypothetical protein